MSYTALTVVGLVGAMVTDMLLLRTRLLTRGAFWASYAIMLAFQLIINGVLTGVGVVKYRAADITGFRIAYAPVEDIGFGFTLILLTLSTWVALNRRQANPHRGSQQPSDT